VSDGRWVPTVEDYLDMAAVVLDSDVARLRRLPRLDLAESAIHAPFASFGGERAYPGLVDQAAVLIAHLAQNHPLPDGNKRAAFLLTARFLDGNGRHWQAQDVEADAGTVERIAAGSATHDEIVAWIGQRTVAA
jgi:death on curing protein